MSKYSEQTTVLHYNLSEHFQRLHQNDIIELINWKMETLLIYFNPSMSWTKRRNETENV